MDSMFGKRTDYCGSCLVRKAIFTATENDFENQTSHALSYFHASNKNVSRIQKNRKHNTK